MIEYKGISNDKNITYYFGNLLINTYNDFILEPKLLNIKLEQFYTFLAS